MSAIIIIQKQLLRLSGIIAILLGVLTIGSWIYPIPKADHLKYGFHPVSQGTRKPSSVITLATPKGVQENLQENMITLKIDCKKSYKKMTSQAKQVRLLFENCQAKNNPRSILKTVNLTNSFIATLFKLPNGGFSTDYIYLKEGENKISIEQSYEEPFKLVSELTITRTTSTTK